MNVTARPNETGRSSISHRVLLMLLVLPFVATGCMRLNVLNHGDNGAVRPLSEPRPFDYSTVPQERNPTQTYRVGGGDVIRIDVYKDPSFTGDYAVTDEGNILLPNIGPISVVDLTTDEIQERVNKELERYIREPEAIVGIREYNSKVVYVVGQVNRPGPLVMRADMLTLEEAIFGAGLPTAQAAMHRAVVIRPDPYEPVVYNVDLSDIIYQGKLRENILLRPNDRVYVPSRYSTNLRAAIRELLGPVEDVQRARSRILIGGGSSNYSGSSDFNY